jgi:hypothetical protein
VSPRSFTLEGLDGANPLGFLAAVGTLVAAGRAGESGARLRWKLDHRWVPVLDGLACDDEATLCRLLARALRGRPVAEAEAARLAAAQKAMEAAKTVLKKRREELKKRKPSRTERREVYEREVRPLEAELRRARESWIEARAGAVPRPELALGKRVEDATGEEYRDLAQRLLGGSAPPSRDALDHLAALGSDACLDEGGRLRATPFEFTPGSGHQFFLDDVRKLIGHVTPDRIHETLFQPWSYRDEGLSVRWDPVEDRRYALLDRDPSDEGARTVWMANLLAYHALALYPAAPGAGGLAVPGWRAEGDRHTFTWPLWEHSADVDTVRSLVAVAELVASRPDAASLRARGIAAAYRAERIVVGSGANRKVNFSPARAVC